MNRSQIALLPFALALPLACTPTRPVDTLPSPPSRTAAAATGSPALDALRARIDRAADPCVDFARFACGAPRPPVAQGERMATLRAVLEDAASAPGDDAQRKLLGDFYAACMDEAQVEAAGVKPLLPLLAKIAKISEPLSFMRTLGELHSIGVPVLFRMVDGPAVDDPQRRLAYFVAGGLGLGNREAYLADDPEARARLSAYRSHLLRMNELLGQESRTAALNADDAVRFETELARVIAFHADAAIPRADCTKTDIPGLDALEPRLAWRTFLQGARASDLAAVGLCSREELEAIGRLLMETRHRTLQAYLRSQLMLAVSGLLDRPFVEEDFAFHGRAAGAHALPPRWQRCVTYTDGAFHDLLVTLDAQRELATGSVAAAESLAAGTKRAFGSSLDALAWMDDATRRAARSALDAAAVEVAAPARARDISALRPERGTFLVNVLEARNLEVERSVAASGAIAQPEGWPLPVTATEARFDRAQGRLLVPAALLRAPRFDPAAPAPVRYGTLGVAVGRSYARGLDPRAETWSSVQSKTRFGAGAECVRSALRSSGTVELEPRVDATLAELGGVHAAYRAWRADSGSAADDELFFVAYAQSVCASAEPDDPWARGRVNATLALTPEFSRALRCAPGSPLRAAEPCPVW